MRVCFHGLAWVALAWLLAAAPFQTLAADVQDSDSRVSFPPDFNDNEALAQPFNLGDRILGDFDDATPPTDDFFYFSATAGNTYQFFAQPVNCTLLVNPTLSIDIDLFISDGFAILQTANAGNACQNELMDFVAPSNGIFFLGVYEGRGVRTVASSYRILTNELTPTPTPGPPSPSPTPPPNASRDWEIYE